MLNCACFTGQTISVCMTTQHHLNLSIHCRAILALFLFGYNMVVMDNIAILWDEAVHKLEFG